MKWTRWTTLIVVVLIALMTVTATACSSKAANEPPSITSLLADPDAVAPGAASTVSCVAGDPDGDTLSYAWEYTGGYLQGTGSTVTWIAPSVANTYTVTVTVSDGNGGTDEDSVAISVGIVSPTPTPTPAPSPTPSDGSIDIKSGSIDGAKVIIDGVDTGMVTPYVATYVSAGNHTVKLDKPYYKWKIGTVTVVGGEPTYINWELESATPQSFTLQPDAAAGKDAYTYETIPGNNYDGTMDLFADASAIGTQTKAYIQFDLAALPSTAVITSAWLELYYDYTSAAVPASIGAYRVIGTWTESGPSGITWNNQPAIAATAEDTVVVPAAVTNNFLFWNIGNLVQSWVDGSVANRGVSLADTDLTTAEAWKGFSSSDNGVAAQNPKLEINYYDPAAP
jgi:hypothetical protein